MIESAPPEYTIGWVRLPKIECFTLDDAKKLAGAVLDALSRNGA
jgi:hypothetical protein